MNMSHLARRIGTGMVALATGLSLVSCMSMPTGGYGGTASSETLADRVNSGLSIQAERGSKTLEIKRVNPGGTRPSGIDKDSWTVFVYLCGSDLESEGAAASKDLAEMVGARGDDNVSFVVETGGARKWRNNTVNSRQLGRYLIQNGSIRDVGSASAANMGDPSTLSDFLDWGIKNYPADHMALILWDHGGGSITGVCFDERNNSDSLSLRELDQALATTNRSMWDKFEFVGFDACLMSTLETANVLASYAKYMVASQESEPAEGWEYSGIVEYLAKNPASTGDQVGKAICDNYLSTQTRATKGFATLAVTDLSQIDQLMQDYYRFSQEMYSSGSDQGTLAAMSRGIQKADNYGCNNWREGYTNMIDLGGLVDACAQVTPSAAEVKNTLNKAITYQIRGTYHAGASGLSTYYPLRVNGSKELSVFETVAVNPSYLSYVDRLVHGATYNGGSPYTSYTGDTFFQNNLWNWLLGNTYEEMQDLTEDHWDYVDDHSDTSSQITFTQMPEVDDEGTFWFQLDQNGINNAAKVSGVLYVLSDDGSDLINLGQTYDVYGDWSSGQFSDDFNGSWLSLPNGQNLNLSVESATEDYIIYTSPVRYNGKERFLRIRQNMKENKAEVEGVWSGVNANGVIDRGLSDLKSGDVIVPLYQAYSVDSSLTESSYEGEEYKLTSDTLTLDYSRLPEGAYLYCFCIEDVFGDLYFTESAKFEVDADGTIYFY